MKLEFTESLTDATRSSVSSAQHRSSLLTLILSNSCTAAFVPVWSLVVISGLLTSNTYVPLSIGVRHRFLKDSSETHGLSRVFRLKNRVYTWVFLAETYYLLEQRRIIHATNFQNFQIPILRFFEQQHRSSCRRSNFIRRMCISVNKLNRQQNWHFLWFCYCLEAVHPQQLLQLFILNYLCQSSSFILFFIVLVFYLVCSSPVLCI